MEWLLWLFLILIVLVVIVWYSLPLIFWLLRGVAIRYGMKKGEKIAKKWWDRKKSGGD